jgi:hypothetical protein
MGGGGGGGVVKARAADVGGGEGSKAVYLRRSRKGRGGQGSLFSGISRVQGVKNIVHRQQKNGASGWEQAGQSSICNTCVAPYNGKRDGNQVDNQRPALDATAHSGLLLFRGMFLFLATHKATLEAFFVLIFCSNSKRKCRVTARRLAKRVILLQNSPE